MKQAAGAPFPLVQAVQKRVVTGGGGVVERQVRMRSGVERPQTGHFGDFAPAEVVVLRVGRHADEKIEEVVHDGRVGRGRETLGHDGKKRIFRVACFVLAAAELEIDVPPDDLVVGEPAPEVLHATHECELVKVCQHGPEHFGLAGVDQVALGKNGPQENLELGVVHAGPERKKHMRRPGSSGLELGGHLVEKSLEPLARELGRRKRAGAAVGRETRKRQILRHGGRWG